MDSPRRLLLAGPLPPPKGGVSVHIERLAGLLADQGQEVELIDESPIRKPSTFNLRSLNPFGYWRRLLKCDLVHVHSSVDLFRLAHALHAIVFRRPFIVTLHSWRPRGALSQRLHRWVFRKARHVVCVSAPIAEQIESNNLHVRPAFIPPRLNDEPALPEHIAEWVASQRATGRRVIASNAYQLDRFENTDIYGTDLCISMMHSLRKRRLRQAALVFNVASLAKGRADFDRYQRLIDELELSDCVLLTHEPELSFVQLLASTDLSIRATNTDGDALSIREALFLGKPVIASDVVARPQGTRLFANRKVDALTAAVEQTLEALKDDRARPEQPEDDSPQFYQTLYASE